tara:strand:- start:546 stop:1667 length:1122 start_codon:yes stop_codon:yes gene_type:complete
MKKNLRNVLVLALGLVTTLSTVAQDWNVESRTRMDMSEVVGEDYKLTTQRVTLGATWGGSDWGIHVSSDFNYNLGDRTLLGVEPMWSIYEAYASADLLGMASLTVGRQAINNGSGALMSTNDFGYDRTTWDGMTLGFDLDMADVTIGYASRNDAVTNLVDTTGEDLNNMWMNLGGEFSGWNVNVLYMTNSMSDDAAYGFDLSGGVMGASVNASMNQDYAGNSMRVVGLGYAVTDDLSVNVGQTAYGDEGNFNMRGTNMDGSWGTTGNIGYLGASMEDLTFGLSYAMGGISLNATMHRITHAGDDVAADAANGVVAYKAEDYDRQAMELGIGYSLGDNASLGLKYVTDEVKHTGSAATTDAQNKYTWITLTVTP